MRLEIHTPRHAQLRYCERWSRGVPGEPRGCSGNVRFHRSEWLLWSALTGAEGSRLCGNSKGLARTIASARLQSASSHEIAPI